MAGWNLARALAAAGIVAMGVSGCGSAGRPRADPRTFYVSPHGSDRASGLSRRRAWRTLARADRQRFNPGDRLLLRGGATFNGSLQLDSSDAGTPEQPVTITSYGHGRARILAGGKSAVLVENAGGIRVSNLVLVGSGPHSNSGSGLEMINRENGAHTLKFVRISGVDASGFGYAGIAVHGDPPDHSQSGYEDVRITSCAVHDNQYFGVIATGYFDPGASKFANKGVYIGHCRAYGNTGDPTFKEDSSGSGLFIEDTDGGMIERSVAYGNGFQNGGTDSGPVGIWTASANHIVIQHNESYDNHTGRLAVDGEGFDLDGGVTNSVLQYNYSQGNDGPGFLLYNYYHSPHSFKNNVARFNISQNDVRRGGYAALLVGNDGNGNFGSEVYGNTVFLSPPPGGAPAAIQTYGTTDARIVDNLIVTTRGEPLVQAASGQDGLTFQGNDYWPDGGPFVIRGNKGVTIRSLAAWRAAGQEAGSRGLSVDPRLVAAGRGKPVVSPARLRTIKAYRLRPSSPLIGAGVDLKALGPGPVDFYGAKLPPPRGYGVGAAQSAGV